MDVVWHDYKFVYRDIRKMARDLHHFLPRYITCSVLCVRLPEKTFLVPGADRNKIIIWRGVVKLLQPGILSNRKTVIIFVNYHFLTVLQDESGAPVGGVMTPPY